MQVRHWTSPVRALLSGALQACSTPRHRKIRSFTSVTAMDTEKLFGVYRGYNFKYPLVIKHSYGKWTFIVVLPTAKWWFSVVMLVYQRVIFFERNLAPLRLRSFVQALAPTLRILQARRCAEPRHASTDDHHARRAGRRAGSGHRCSVERRTRPMNSRYPLVDIQKSMEKHHFCMGK